VTIPEAIEAMRRNVGTPGEAGAMMVLADVWEEHEANTKGVICRECHARLWLPDQKSGTACDACNGAGVVFVSNGNSARAEALRLLAECGKVGAKNYGYGDRGIADETMAGSASVADGWLHTAMRPFCPSDEGDFYGIITNRLALIDAYAAADQPTRERWARETRALVPRVVCEACRGVGLTYVYMGHGDHDQQGCWPCNGTGRVPAPQEATL
jgi:hypothetical protein